MDEQKERAQPREPTRKVSAMAIGQGPRGPELVAVDTTGQVWRLLLGEDSKFLRWQPVPELPAEVPTEDYA